MTVIQTVCSIFSMVLQNCLFNKICKKDLESGAHIHRFNIGVYFVCVLFFGALLIGDKLSLFTLLLALLFGIVTALSAFYKMRALTAGPMHLTLLITTASMIIPTLSGIFFGESFSVFKLLAVILLLFFIFLSLGQKKGGPRANFKWIFFCLIAFLMQGAIGVLQKVHQASSYKSETAGFLFIAFLCSLIYSTFEARKTFGSFKMSQKLLLASIVCGICALTMNYLNLRLSGLLPSQLFFPIVNGSSIVLSAAASVLFFKEKLTKMQTVGLIGGIASLILICLVP